MVTTTWTCERVITGNGRVYRFTQEFGRAELPIRGNIVLVIERWGVKEWDQWGRLRKWKEGRVGISIGDSHPLQWHA